MRTAEGFLVLSKRQPGPNDAAEVLIAPAAVRAVEPHRTGCYVYAGGHKWDVAHSHAEIVQAVNAALRGERERAR